MKSRLTIRSFFGVQIRFFPAHLLYAFNDLMVGESKVPGKVPLSHTVPYTYTLSYFFLASGSRSPLLACLE